MCAHDKGIGLTAGMVVDLSREDIAGNHICAVRFGNDERESVHF